MRRQLVSSLTPARASALRASRPLFLWQGLRSGRPLSQGLAPASQAKKWKGHPPPLAVRPEELSQSPEPPAPGTFSPWEESIPLPDALPPPSFWKDMFHLEFQLTEPISPTACHQLARQYVGAKALHAARIAPGKNPLSRFDPGMHTKGHVYR